MPGSLVEVGWRTAGVARGLRRLVRHPVRLDDAHRAVSDELAHRSDRFLAQLDELVWPYPRSPTRRLLELAGLDAGGVAELVEKEGLEGALERLRDAGVYVAYEEYQGTQPLRRGSTTLDVDRADFFNPVTRADFMGSTSASRSAGTSMEMSFAYQRRKAVTRRLLMAALGIDNGPVAVWLPVFPSSAGFSAVMLYAAAGAPPARWFSQVPVGVRDITRHKRMANRLVPLLYATTRAGLPSPRYVPSDEPRAVVDWLAEQVATSGRVAIQGYASSITAAAHDAVRRGVDLTGTVAIPSGEPITEGKLAAMRSAGMSPAPAYAFTPEGIVGSSCPDCPDDEYHLWEHELAVISRRRSRSDGVMVDALLWTSLSREAPRVLLNVENDDYATVRRGASACASTLGRLGMRTTLSGIRGLSKVVAGGVTVEGELLDHIVDVTLPARLGGVAGDFQFVELEEPQGTALAVRVHPRVADVDEAALVDAVRDALRTSDNGVLADEVWSARPLQVLRQPPVTTAAGKLLAYDRSAPRPQDRQPR